RALLGAEDALRHRAFQQIVEPRHRFHQPHAVPFLLQTLVDLQEGDHAAVLQEDLRRGLAADLAVHGLLEEDRTDDALAVEGGRGGDACPHLVYETVHLLVGLPGFGADAVELQRLGGRAAALVERGDEALAAAHLIRLFLPCHDDLRSRRRIRTPGPLPASRRAARSMQTWWR